MFDISQSFKLSLNVIRQKNNHLNNQSIKQALLKINQSMTSDINYLEHQNAIHALCLFLCVRASWYVFLYTLPCLEVLFVLIFIELWKE